MKNLLFFCFIILPFFGHAQHCMTGGPSSFDDSNVKKVTLNGVTGGINYTGCPAVPGVQDLTATQQVTLTANNPYTVFIEFGTCGGNFAGVGEAWIDFDSSGTFDASESIGSWQGTPPSTLMPYSFTVPHCAKNGPLRMRVMQQESGTLPLNPCASFTWGSVVDFTVNVQGGLACVTTTSFYCTSGGPTSTTNSNVKTVTLNGVSGGINYTGCPGVAGVQDLTATQQVTLTANNSYTANIEFGTCGSNIAGVGEAWIDFDSSGTFTPNESIATWQGTPPSTLTAFTFNLPFCSKNGPIRMRVIQREGGTLPLNPCAAFLNGSVVDFTIIIQGGNPCIPNPGAYCVTAGPSSTGDSNVKQVTLNGVAGGINYTGCPGVAGVQDLSAIQQVTLNAGSAYTANIEFGTCGGNYGGVGEAWIDFDNSESFEPNESIGTWAGTPPSTLTAFNFSVPSVSNNGATRMRVMQRESGSLPLDPCGNFTWGSVVDFTVVIQGGVICNGNKRSNALLVPQYPYTDTGSTIGCFSSQSAVYSSPDVFYLAILDPAKDSLKVSLCGSAFDTHLAIQNADGTVIYYNDDFGACAPQSEVFFPTAGLDSVYIVIEGWSSESGTYILNIDNDYIIPNVAVHHIAGKDYEFTIYPNPTQGIINIEGILPDQLLIYSIDGKLLQAPVFNNNSLDISNLSAGIYILELQYEGHRFREKIVKQ